MSRLPWLEKNCLQARLSVCLPVCLYVNRSINRSVGRSIDRSVSRSVGLSVGRFVCLCMPIYLSNRPSVCPSARPSFCLFAYLRSIHFTCRIFSPLRTELVSSQNLTRLTTQPDPRCMQRLPASRMIRGLLPHTRQRLATCLTKKYTKAFSV